ncbi:hypothetical protein ACHAPT_009760 [Fusarium lateritium]
MKRQRGDDELSRSGQLSKKIKAAVEGNFTPAFWDNLSKVWLTPNALKEIDRRNALRPASTTSAPRVCPKDVARFARRGGPDLCHLRGYAYHQLSTCEMSSSRSTMPQGSEVKAMKTSAYCKNFERHLNNYNIYLAGHKYGDGVPAPKPQGSDWRRELKARRASLSPSRFPSSAFEEFINLNNEAKDEGDIVQNVIPILCGDAKIHNQQDILFANLDAITGEKEAVRPKPDFVDGARLQDLSRSARNDPELGSLIIPTKRSDATVAPNFFLEVKGPSGNPMVARRQAGYDGAYGARAMDALYNNGRPYPTYDGNPRVFSSTYNSSVGTLQLYAHHTTAPTAEGGRPEYHMTQVGSYALTNDRETFVQGATAFRNARLMAERHRDDLIQTASGRTSQAESVPASQPLHAEDDSHDPSQESLIQDPDPPASSPAPSFMSRCMAMLMPWKRRP